MGCAEISSYNLVMKPFVALHVQISIRNMSCGPYFKEGNLESRDPERSREMEKSSILRHYERVKKSSQYLLSKEKRFMLYIYYCALELQYMS